MKEGLRYIKNKLLYFYYSNLENTIVDNILIRIENIKKIQPTNTEYSSYKCNGAKLDIELLIATQSRGLLFYSKGRICQLFSNKGFYGISQFGDEYFVFCKNGLHGNIISFKIEDNKAVHVKTRIFGLSKGIHQIDFVNNDLFITDTYNNSLLIYDNLSEKTNVNWKKYHEISYPNGKVLKGRESRNYCHFNSIYKYKDKIFLVAHNETKKTGKLSEIYELSSKDLNVIKKYDTSGSNCHNYYKDESITIYLKSLEGAVNVNNEDVIKHSDVLKRGLSVSKDYIIVGGSDIEFDRAKRKQTTGYIDVYDYKYNLLHDLVIFDTQIQEIRRVKGKEFTYSNNE